MQWGAANAHCLYSQWGRRLPMSVSRCFYSRNIGYYSTWICPWPWRSGSADKNVRKTGHTGSQQIQPNACAETWRLRNKSWCWRQCFSTYVSVSSHVNHDSSSLYWFIFFSEDMENAKFRYLLPSNHNEIAFACLHSLVSTDSWFRLGMNTLQHAWGDAEMMFMFSALVTNCTLDTV